MADRKWLVSCAGFICALVLVSFSACAAEGDQLLATVTRPAVLTVTPRLEKRDRPPRLEVVVTGYRRASDSSSVQGVVKAQQSGTDKEQEIGRFGIFPDADFKAPSEAQRFGFDLPSDFATDGAVKVKIEVVPVRGTGKGAEMDIGSAEIK